MYTIALVLHSWLRWLVLALGLGVFAGSYRAWRGGGHAPTDGGGLGRLPRTFLATLDLQLLIGLGLYFALSPISRAGLQDMGSALGDSVLRFYSVEHPFGMVVGVLVAHVGWMRARRHEGDRRHRILCLTAASWLVITLVSIPWPGLPYGRALFRF